MANFEAFHQVISSSINLLFLKSVLAKKVNALEEGPFVLPQRVLRLPFGGNLTLESQ